MAGAEPLNFELDINDDAPPVPDEVLKYTGPTSGARALCAASAASAWRR